jgi:hypothetical protein
LTDLILQMAKENSGWGYDRIVGALANLGHVISDQPVGNILRRYGVAPAPKRSQGTTWRDFIAAHMAVLVGIDFFTVEVLTWRPRHILRLILHPSGESVCDHRRHHQTSNGRVDTADRPQCNRCEHRMP